MKYRRDEPQSRMKAMFVEGNGGMNIRNGDGIRTEKGKQIVKAIYGEGEKSIEKLGRGIYDLYGLARSGFDVVSCQFALHYFTKNDDHMMTFDESLVNTIKNFLTFNPQ